MIEISEKKKCSGCHACAAICPMQCIAMQRDEEGFLYPQVDSEKCIRCGLCESVCPVINPSVREDKDKVAYAAYAEDENLRMQSSSGGVFTLLAEIILAKGGVVFGAAMDEEQKCIHICAHTPAELERLRGSKYVQSVIGNTFQEAEKFLKQGRPVLFTGTPCQIAGLHRYLRKEYDNLFTQDIICHGVPSPLVWEKYVKFREMTAASKTRRTFFRHKKNGWKTFCVQFEFSNCTQYVQTLSEDLYMKAFLKDLCLRPSCYACGTKGHARSSDITLADFWGVWNIAPEMDDDKGTSLVLINSPKGKVLFEEIKQGIVFKEVEWEEAVKYNSAFSKSVVLPDKREAFMETVLQQGFAKTKIILDEPFLKRALRKGYRIIKNIWLRNGETP